MPIEPSTTWDLGPKSGQANGHWADGPGSAILESGMGWMAVLCLSALLPSGAAAQNFTVGNSSTTEQLKDALKQAADKSGQGAAWVFDASASAAAGNPSAAAPAPRSLTNARLVSSVQPVTTAHRTGALTVQNGDTLAAIAQRTGVPLATLIAANPQFSNPNLIHPGDTVYLAGGAAATGSANGIVAGNYYRVSAGDTLASIAARSGVSAQMIAAANGSGSFMSPGNTIVIPSHGWTPATGAQATVIRTVAGQVGRTEPGADPRIASMAASYESNPGVNPNNGTTNWNGWCLGFVGNVASRATGHPDPGLNAGYARAAYYNMVSEGRVSTNFSAMPAGAAVFWTAGQYGHVAVFSGRYTSSGDPIIISSTGWGGRNGIQEIPLSELNREVGQKAVGYAPL